MTSIFLKLATFQIVITRLDRVTQYPQESGSLEKVSHKF